MSTLQMEKASLHGQLIRSQELETLIGLRHQLVLEDLMERRGEKHNADCMASWGVSRFFA